MSSSFSDRINDVVSDLSQRRFNVALTLLVTLIDRSAKDTYKIKKIGERFERMIDDNKDFLFWFNSGGSIMVGKEITILEKPFKEIIYKLIRNCLVHDAELPEIDFVEGPTILSSKDGKIFFNTKLIFAFLLMICYLPCNKHRFPKNIVLNFNTRNINLDDFCGEGKMKAISEIMRIIGD